MDTKYIKEILDEGIEEEGTLSKAFDYLLENWLRDLFPMNDWDEPEFRTTIIEYDNKIYQIHIQENGLCEHTNGHKIMFWKHKVNEIK